MKKKKIYKKVTYKAEQYVNIETGEVMSSETQNGMIIKEVETDKELLSSNKYTIIDNDASAYLEASKILLPTDFYQLWKLMKMPSGIYNALEDKNGKEHNNSSLMLDMNYSRNSFYPFMKRLHEEGIIAYLDIYVKSSGGRKERKKFILLNPYLARRSKVFHTQCLALFEDFRKNVIRLEQSILITSEQRENINKIK